MDQRIHPPSSAPLGAGLARGITAIAFLVALVLAPASYAKPVTYRLHTPGVV
jgi:hypothetical protein